LKDDTGSRIGWVSTGGYRVAGECDTEHEDDDEAQDFFISDASRMRTGPGSFETIPQTERMTGVQRVHEGDLM
jgi:hypothetical protein